MQSDLHMERHTMPSTTATVSGPADWNEALDIISYGSPEQVSSSSVQSIDYSNYSLLFLQFLPFSFEC